MRIDLPQCGFSDCRKCFDGNCRSLDDFRSCEFAIDKSRLNAYVDLEEQGRLIELPCNMGDTVYIHYQENIVAGNVTDFIATFKGIYVYVKIKEIDLFDNDGRSGERIVRCMFGRDAFLKREEVEEKLKELQQVN